MNQPKKNIKPDFILCDTEVSAAFARLCQNFQKPDLSSINNSSNWLIIDNDTGEIITPDLSINQNFSK